MTSHNIYDFQTGQLVRSGFLEFIKAESARRSLLPPTPAEVVRYGLHATEALTILAGAKLKLVGGNMKNTCRFRDAADGAFAQNSHTLLAPYLS